MGGIYSLVNQPPMLLETAANYAAAVAQGQVAPPGTHVIDPTTGSPVGIVDALGNLLPMVLLTPTGTEPYGVTSAQFKSLVANIGRQQNTIALIGDSITYNNFPAPSGGYSVYSSAGYFTVANALMNWAWEISGTFGYSGQTSTYILGQLSNVLALSPLPACCVILAGTNDRQAGITPAQSMANVEAMVAQLLQAGITPFLATIPPRNDAGQTAAMQRLDCVFNRHLREYARTYNLVIFDFYRRLVNPTSAGPAGYALASENVGALNDLSVDQIHPNNAGAYLMGLEIQTKLAGHLQLQSLGGQPRISDCMYTTAGGAMVEGNIIPNGSFSGTGGSIGSIATGQLADEWSRQGDQAPAGGGTIVLSKVPRTDTAGWWQQITISGGTAGDNEGYYQIRSDQDYPSVFGQLGPSTWQVGDQVWGQVEFQCDASGWANGGDTNCNLAIRVQFLGATGAITDIGWGLNAAGSSKYRMPSGVLRTPTTVIPPGTTAIYFWIYVTGRGTWRFDSAEVRKVITP